MNPEGNMNEIYNYDEAVEIIKTAILQSQYDAARSVNEKQLTLYYGIGKYISLNSRNGFWGKERSTLSVQSWTKSCPVSEAFLRGIFGICVCFMRNGLTWTQLQAQRS